MRRSQKQGLLLNKEREAKSEVGGGGGSESYSSNSSFSDSYSDSSDLANWEEFVAEDGSLFYAEYMPLHSKASGIRATTGAASGDHAEGTSEASKVEFTRTPSLRMGKKARKQQQQERQKQKQQQQKQQQQQQKHKQQQQHGKKQFLFNQISSNVESAKQLQLSITASDRYRFGRRSTAVESILGFRVVAFPDQPECLMVDELINNDLPALQNPNESLKRGDWFKSLDDIEIRASNVDDLLLQFVEPTKVTLKFQGLREPTGAAENVPTTTASGQVLQKVTNFASFGKIFELLQLGDAPKESTTSTEETLPFAMLIISPECFQRTEHKNSLFYYPEDQELNFLYKGRGGFLTMNAVLTDEMHTPPLLSKLKVKGVPYFVCFRRLNDFLVLFAFNERCQTMKEATLRTDEMMHHLCFALPTLHLEQLAPAVSPERTLLQNFALIQHVRILTAHRQGLAVFEELLPESRFMPLPKEAQLRIFDALSEMEAMDYRNWNDEPLNTHREFFIHGSVLYYEHFMLVSQMPVESRAHIDSFLRCRGVFDFIAGHNVRELYVWQEIEMPNAAGRFFLAICSRGHLILAAILKLFDAAPEVPSADRRVPPSLFYIEEIQETLDHLIQCGIESLAMFWAVSNKRPEVLEKLEPHDSVDTSSNAERYVRKFETLLKQKLSGPSSSSAAANSGSSSQTVPRCDEEAHLCSSLAGSSIHCEEDTIKRRSNVNVDESDSDGGSDWEDFTAQRPPPTHSGGAACQTEMNASLWREINNVLPVNISPGWRNSIYYYIYIDTGNGTILCPTKINPAQFQFIRELRLALHNVHNVLLDTKKRRKKRSQQASGQATDEVCNGACSGVCRGPAYSGAACSGDDDCQAEEHSITGEGSDFKEHGMTITVRDKTKEEEDDICRGKGAIRGRFTVVGRLFTCPPREVYICHNPDVSQNIIETAFRLSFFTVG